MKRHDLISLLDAAFDGLAPDDVSNNGLQVDVLPGSGPEHDDIRRVAFAVDACLETFRIAAERRADLLFVHHGISWGGGIKRFTPLAVRQLDILFRNRIALYAQHLPLDLHPQFGNNITLARCLNLRNIRPFGSYHGRKIGFAGDLPTPLRPGELARTLGDSIGATVDIPVVAPGQPPVRSVGIVSGGGDDAVPETAPAGLDAFITGELTHVYVHPARESGITVLAAGHYATETTGPKAFMETVRTRTGLDCFFIDVPTGR